MRQLNRRTLAALAAVVVAAVTLGVGASARTAHSTTASATTIHVKAFEFGFTLSAKSARRGKVTFVVRNIGLGEHDFKINGKTTPLIQKGTTVKLTVTFTNAGKYPYRCTVGGSGIGGHAAAGMRGIFTIR
jgi:plastocyanin